MSDNQELILRLSKLYIRLTKKVDQGLSVHGISFSEFQVLHYLNTAPNKTMRRIDLAESIGLTASGVTRLVNPMEKNHLVERERNLRDARVSLVRPASAGEELCNNAVISLQRSADYLLKPLGIKGKKALEQLCSVLP